MPVLGTQKVSPREGQGSRVGMLSVRRSVLGSRAAGFAWSEGPEGDVPTGPGRPAAVRGPPGCAQQSAILGCATWGTVDKAAELSALNEQTDQKISCRV